MGAHKSFQIIAETAQLQTKHYNCGDYGRHVLIILVIIWRSGIQSVITAFSFKTKRTSNVYVSLPQTP